MSSKKEEIVATAKDLLWRVGYEAMSPRRLLEESGAGQGSLYHHFRGKKHVASIALNEIAGEMRRDFDEAAANGEDPLQWILGFLRQKRVGTLGCRLGRLANETAIDDPELRRPIADFFSHVEGAVREGLAAAVKSGRLPAKTDTRRLARAVIAVVQGGYALSRIHRDPKFIMDATAAAADMLEGLST